LDITEIPHVDVDWARFDYNGKGMKMRAEKQGTFAFRTIRRHEFDAWLARKAAGRGIEIREGIAVESVTATKECVAVETNAGTFTAKVVVGADGSRGVVRRSIVRNEPAHVARLLEIATEPRPDRSFHIQTDSYFDFFVVPQGILGYTWDFPALENGQPVRVRGIYDSNVHHVQSQVSLKEALTEEFRRHGLDLESYKLEGHPLRWFDVRSTFSVPRILLIGDAAGADALYGEGISFALGYGVIAARAIQDAFTRKDFSFKRYKASILRSELGKALRWRTWFARLFYLLRSRRIQSLVWRNLGPIVECLVRKFVIGWAGRERQRGKET
jgi:flavin-dependent dehydrogenase